MKKQLLLFLFFLFSSIYVSSQVNADSSNFVPMYRHGIIYTIETTVGTRHTGFVVLETKDYIVIENRITLIKTEILKSQIVPSKTNAMKKKYEEEVFGENYHAANYMVSGTAFDFKEGNSYANTHYLLFTNADYALTDHWAVTVGTIWFYPVSLGTKFSFKIDSRNFYGFSASGFGNIFAKSGTEVFWAYTALARFTHGTGNNNFTISGGLLGVNNQFIDPSYSPGFTNIPFVSGAYCNRFHEKFAFNGEVWLFPASMIALAGAGLKFMRSNIISWSFGCYTNIISENNTLKLNTTTIPIPYLGYSRKLL